MDERDRDVHPDLTLLMTDVEGSTRLWEGRPDAMREALVRHDALARRCVARGGGHILKERGEGDSLFAVFPAPEGALRAAVDFQAALADEPWPGGLALRVRCAIHTGAVSGRDGDFYGVEVNRCARLRGVAHGGQVLVSGRTAGAVGTLPEGARLIDLGGHRLRDLQDEERVHQLWHPHLPSLFPPLRSLRPPPHDLPAERTSFVGREGELVALSSDLQRHRLVTLVGPGGVGKTRVAVRAARLLLQRWPDGVWMADLAGVADPDDVPRAVAAAVKAPPGPGDTAADSVVAHLRDRTVLVVLDNCEHLLDACADLVDRLLESCDGVTLLATSREELGVYGELRRPLETLPEAPAVALFQARAALVRPDLRLEGEDLERARRVCARVDGLPLAIELAAARMLTLEVGDIERALEDRFGLLQATLRRHAPRHAGLEALIDWSHELLEAEEQVVFRRLSVFAGGFDADAAAVVAGDGLEPSRMPELLERLVRRSLVACTPGAPAPHRLLESIREYAARRLVEAGEGEAAARGHARFHAELTRALDPQRRRTPQRMVRLRAATDNLRAALRWALERDEGALAADLAYGVWRAVASPREGRDALLAAARLPGCPGWARARALAHAAWLVAELGDRAEAERLGREALDLARAAGDATIESLARNSLSFVALEAGDHDGYHDQAAAQLRAAERSGDSWYVALAFTSVGISAELRDDFGAAREAHTRALENYEAEGDANGRAVSLVNLADVAVALRDREQARTTLIEALHAFEELEDARGRLWTSWGLGALAVADGAPAEAAGWLRSALELADELGSRGRTAGILTTIAGLHVGQRPALAATLAGAADAIGVGAAALPFGALIGLPDAIRGRAAERLGERAAAAAFAEGAALSPAAAVALGLEATEPGAESMGEEPAPAPLRAPA